ncbi:response regulator transcription factor [Halomonas sp. McH1-25]|uniref:response regulator transcription factor n=1 Tax=unclassified Halomonas TaxID=2609666 RepID=UPI001EF697E1|nr:MULTISPECIES: response regulator transcription factor [unclassified Halomonas]MCG7601851.1 response regulator transcription factor [Halomonas sp. McH1-25]MCP1343530.1 response regulator transcription factor [Halomonas sp. FL8]MCP1361646.1 response regulator transcription factor [Halomonas sp. BBD45]MCP1363664.1 response regulator transcription factor [Halomonas sp. BBD48]
MRLLLVEDDDLLAESLSETLEDEGYRVDVSARMREAVSLMASEEYSLVILDLGLPDGSGLELLDRWRRDGRCLPILALTARDSWEDKVDGLRRGADDYLTKPYHEAELLARLHALLRRSTGAVEAVLSVNGITLDEVAKQASGADGSWHTLTSTEYCLLRYLMRYPDRVHSKESLLSQLYTLGQDAAAPNLIEVYIGRLRRLLGKHSIQTRRGQGYVFPSHRS